MVHVMIYDFLIGPNKVFPKGSQLLQDIKGGGQVKKVILMHKNALQTALVRIKVKARAKENKDLLPEHLRNPGIDFCGPSESGVVLPRYVRVNTLKVETGKVLGHFQEKLKE